MTATFVNEFNKENSTTDASIEALEDGNFNDKSEDVIKPTFQTNQAPADTEDDYELPEKYKGKSAKELARMHAEAEKALGRQGSEVGDLRKIVDDFVKTQSTNKQSDKTVNEQADDEVDFFTDPQKAIDRAISKHPKILEAEQLTSNMKKAEALANLKANHPDFQEIIAAPSFAEWIGKSKVRQELFVRADRAYDADAANELLDNWKERSQAVERTKVNEQSERSNAIKAASTGTTRGSSEPVAKKRYRRADIIDLMTRDPDRYMALEPEIMKAYAEKRVY